jgi:hypothetical protein
MSAALGAFGPAAGRFAERFLGGALPRGVEGLSGLAAAIDRFAEDGAPEHEDAFLEGAGAALGVIVIEHFAGRARHVERRGLHRLALGRAGFADPFAIVARLLAGETRARPALVREVLALEAEIAGTGPIARVALAFEAELAPARPELRVVDRFERALFLSDETEIDLSQAIAASEDHEAGSPALQRTARKLVSMLPGGVPVLAPEGRLERLVPRLIGPSFPEGNGVHAVPLAGELRLALTERHEGRARFLLARDIDALGLPHDALVLRALDNLARASLGTRVLEDGALLLLRSGDGLDSSRLLLPGLVATFAPRLGEGFLAGVPHRDALWLARSGDAPALRARIEDDFARAPHRISARPVRVEATQLVALP